MNLKVISQNSCSPCQMVKNYLLNENVKFDEINISSNTDAIGQYGIMSTPVSILFDEGEEVARVQGFNPPELDTLIEQL